MKSKHANVRSNLKKRSASGGGGVVACWCGRVGGGGGREAAREVAEEEEEEKPELEQCRTVDCGSVAVWERLERREERWSNN